MNTKTLSTDEKYMREALQQAKKAALLDEVPIGCVIVYEDRIIARGYNRRSVDRNTTAHAEISAIRKAGKVLGDWRLEGCTIYITLEPCPMCAGAIVQARIDRAVIACMNPKAGCAGSIVNLLDMPQFNHQVELTTGVLEQECSTMLSAFFRGLRERARLKKSAAEAAQGAKGAEGDEQHKLPETLNALAAGKLPETLKTVDEK